ncbi:Mitochondrial import inner membrane translocase subunit TIM50 [Apostasia shenzhenica]|uniref:Mitochondrial import inner membrane translocase subunit TIM50 n=1 Tax=Apostasia shenzhenica TaxID=1088818 RepID=A0A2I0B694_9ASPA|nr:Mitochondrial import inner membrane translocase subunit TIM50 [Apostasia shenzhenica]
MAELEDAEALAASAVAGDSRSAAQAWRAVMGWMGVILQIVIQILRFSPSSLAQILSFIGLRDHPHPLLSSSTAFKPLPGDISDATAPPPPSQVHPSEYLKKLTIVLDLDETLVCAYEASSLPAVVRSQAIEAGLKCFELQCISADKVCIINLLLKEVEGREKVNHVVVFERPGLQEFLEKISEFADLVLFTAGLEGYASPLVDIIDVNNRVSLRLYRPATISTEYRPHVKDLSCISQDLCRIVIVDNNPFSFLLQPVNGIPCVPFSAGQPYDDQLLKVILPLLKQLSLQKDVRPVLYEKFHMPEWFQNHGIPSYDYLS